MKSAHLAAALAITCGLAACSAAVSEAELTEKARVATAHALGLDPALAAIEVTTVQRGATSASWSAHYDGAPITCSGNEKFQLPDCRVAQETASN